MKILFAIKRLSSAVGGAERVLCLVCSCLVKRGHEVTILTFDAPGGKPFYAIDSRVKRIDLNVGDSSKSAGIIETVSRMAVLRRTVKTERPDVAVGFMHSMFVPLAVALINSGVPVVGSEHIVPEHYRTRRFQFLLLILSALFIEKFTALSPKIISSYPYVVRKRMVDIPNPVLEPLESNKVPSSDNNCTVLSVGRLDFQKDHATLIRAFSRISERFSQWSLKIVGDGALRSDLERLINDLKLNNVVFLPGVTSEIAEEYMAAEIFVIPSRYESFGLVTAEAMSYGLPVIGFSDCSGTNELLVDGETGVLVVPGNDRVSELSNALALLMSRPMVRERLGKAARESISDRFSLDKVCFRWETLLNAVSRRA